MPATAREAITSPNKTRDGTWQLEYTVHGTTDDQQAIAAVYLLNPPLIFNGQPRKPGEGLSWDNRGVAKVTLEFGPSQDQEDDPQGDLPTIGTMQMSGAGITQHTTQCLSQVAYPAGKGQTIVDAQVVGLHRDGVNGTDIHVPGTKYSLTKKWLPPALTGAYFNGLDDLQGRTNKSQYTLQWGFNKRLYSITCDPGELVFLNYNAKTDFTLSGIGVWEVTYEMLRIKNRTNFKIGVDKNAAPITVATKKGHEYLWVWYSKKEMNNPSVFIEVPEMVFVSKMYEDVDFQPKLGF